MYIKDPRVSVRMRITDVAADGIEKYRTLQGRTNSFWSSSTRARLADVFQRVRGTLIDEWGVAALEWCPFWNDDPATCRSIQWTIFSPLIARAEVRMGAPSAKNGGVQWRKRSIHAINELGAA
ncbi:hypothetical protein ABZ366_02050 [Streptomyces sp. NPDC005904]|uniref:hypothetical protein n=1 Tax=Streptomyces sp. NPDC005904 TaxID=3154570 RepID=UPI00340C7033